jgi:hypothetical protein
MGVEDERRAERWGREEVQVRSITLYNTFTITLYDTL